MIGFNKGVFGFFLAAIIGVFSISCRNHRAITFFYENPNHPFNGIGVEKKIGTFNGYISNESIGINTKSEVINTSFKPVFLGDTPYIIQDNLLVEYDSGRQIRITSKAKYHLYGGSKGLLFLVSEGDSPGFYLASHEDLNKNEILITDLKRMDGTSELIKKYDGFYLLDDARLICFGDDLSIHFVDSAHGNQIIKDWKGGKDPYWNYSPSSIFEWEGRIVWATDMGDAVVVMNPTDYGMVIDRSEYAGVLLRKKSGCYLLKKGWIKRKLF